MSAPRALLAGGLAACLALGGCGGNDGEGIGKPETTSQPAAAVS